MNDRPTITGTGPWRILVLDRDPADPKWILATVMDPGDVRPAGLGERGLTGWAAVTTWLHGLLGRPAKLTPLFRPDVWRIDETLPEDR